MALVPRSRRYLIPALCAISVCALQLVFSRGTEDCGVPTLVTVHLQHLSVDATLLGERLPDLIILPYFDIRNFWVSVPFCLFPKSLSIRRFSRRRFRKQATIL
jgi:hypothetical protein